MATDQNKPALSGHIVEITDEDENLVVTFVPVDSKTTFATLKKGH